ncbi:MAG: gliding motility lipoprotein GldD [Flavobacteriaceae bacterium]|nr:gliding motility lipoprotein GldD [Flavobacteriaceae bacterium]
MLDAKYEKLSSDCPFTFDYSSEHSYLINENAGININYPGLKASINITYRPVQNNLQELFMEAEKLTSNHTIKADGISSVPFEDKINKLYGSLYKVTGNAASPIQFHLTDSSKHFITGAVYFNVPPNFDSILPAVSYLERDIQHLMESAKWKNK